MLELPPLAAHAGGLRLGVGTQADSRMERGCAAVSVKHEETQVLHDIFCSALSEIFGGVRNMKIGTKVKMNDRYYVSEKNRGKVFTTRSEPWMVCGTMVVLLEGLAGGYAVDGLDVVQAGTGHAKQRKGRDADGWHKAVDHLSCVRETGLPKGRIRNGRLLLPLHKKWISEAHVTERSRQ